MADLYILSGRVPAPEIASPMYDIIEGASLPSNSCAYRVAAEGLDETGLPAEGYVPTAAHEHTPVPSPNQGYKVGAEGVRGQAQTSTQSPTAPSGNQTVFDHKETR